MGFPPKSASALSGSRVDALRAGIRTVNSGCGIISVDQWAGVGFKHDRNPIPNREREPIHAAAQFRRGAVMLEWTFAEGADKNIKQSGVQRGAPQ